MSITSGVSMRASDRSVLAQFLRREMSYRGITSTHKLAEFIGDLSQGTAWRLLASSRVPSEETLRKVARAFNLPITEVRDMANRPSGEANPMAWPQEFNQLSNPERDALFEIGWRMIEAHDRGKVTR